MDFFLILKPLDFLSSLINVQVIFQFLFLVIACFIIFFYLCHAVWVYLRCILPVCVLLWWPSFETILVDQDSAMIPLLKLKTSPVVLACIFF
jgi:hypothetical protein